VCSLAIVLCQMDIDWMIGEGLEEMKGEYHAGLPPLSTSSKLTLGQVRECLLCSIETI